MRNRTANTWISMFPLSSLGYGNKQEYHERTANRQVPDHRQERACRGQDLPGEEPGSRQLLCELHRSYWTATTSKSGRRDRDAFCYRHSIEDRSACSGQGFTPPRLDCREQASQQRKAAEIEIEANAILPSRTGSKSKQSRVCEPRCRSIRRMLASPHILAGVLPIRRSNKAVIPTNPRAIEQELIF